MSTFTLSPHAIDQLTASVITSQRHDVGSALRLVLIDNEVYAMRDRQMIRVIAGTAYVSHNGHDMILQAGANAVLDTTMDAALVSAAAGSVLVIEVRY
jgi:hypothetical protein